MLTNRKLFDRISSIMVKTKMFFTVTEIAKKIGISRQAVDKRIRSRKTPFDIYGRTRLINKLEMQGLLTKAPR